MVTTMTAKHIVAECERCGGEWLVVTSLDPVLENMEGTCQDCTRESDAERPLTFRRAGGDHPLGFPKLPDDWWWI